jgi:hypothetical protein
VRSIDVVGREGVQALVAGVPKVLVQKVRLIWRWWKRRNVV